MVAVVWLSGAMNFAVYYTVLKDNIWSSDADLKLSKSTFE